MTTWNNRVVKTVTRDKDGVIIETLYTIREVFYTKRKGKSIPSAWSMEARPAFGHTDADSPSPKDGLKDLARSLTRMLNATKQPVLQEVEYMGSEKGKPTLKSKLVECNPPEFLTPKELVKACATI